MNFKEWLILDAVTPQELHTQEREKLTLVDEVSAENYLMQLLKSGSSKYPHDMRYQLVIQKTGAPKQTSPIKKFDLLMSGHEALEPLTKKLDEWLELYGEITISSTDIEKTRKWASALNYLGYNLTRKLFKEMEYYVINNVGRRKMA
jgi:hypothetical protein